MIYHSRPSYPYGCFYSRLNGKFISILWEAKEQIKKGSYLEMMAQLTQEFRRRSGHSSSMLRPYLEHLAEAMAAWVKALQ